MRTFTIAFILLLSVAIFGCSHTEKPDMADTTSESMLFIQEDENEEVVPEEDDLSGDDNSDTYEDDIKVVENESRHLLFRDVFGVEYETDVNPNVTKNEYENEKYRHDEDRLYYDDTAYDCLLGVDVSHHQGAIDWAKVKAHGYDFAFIRLGYRGYGREGVIKLDKEFDINASNAREAGLQVGVYFFAQAINEAEAVEEAEFVLEHLSGHVIDLPVVYDPESILDDDARTDDVSGEQFTKNTVAFCETIRAAGYEPMVYCNMLWEAFNLDLEELSGIPIWYADYEAIPQTPYAFVFWQYTNEGHVDGIKGVVDLDIWMREV